MHRYTLSCSAEAADFEPIVIAVHELIHRLPVTAKSLEKDGIRVEDGRVIDRHYNGPVLLDVIAKNQTIQVTPTSGAYKGVPVTVTPIRDKDGNAIGAIGIVDITGIGDLRSRNADGAPDCNPQAGMRQRPLPAPFGTDQLQAVM